MSQTAYCPWPPDCLTCRPWPVRRAGERLAQRHPQRHRLDVDAVAVAQPVEQHVERAPRPCTTARAGGSRGCSPAAASGPRRPAAPRPWRELVLVGLGLARRSATGSSGSGISHGSISSGSSLAESVSPVSARPSLATAQMSPAMACGDGPLGLAERRGQRADPLVDVVVLVAAVGQRSGRTRARSRPGAGCRRTRGPARCARRTGRWWS